MAELTCRYCGTPLTPGAALCRDCGRPPTPAPVSAPPAPAAPPAEDRAARVRRALAAADSPLPPALRDRYRVEGPLEVPSTEADLFLVVETGDDAGAGAARVRQVLKRYREPQIPRSAPGASPEQIAVKERAFEADRARDRAALRDVLTQLGQVEHAHVIGIHGFDVDEGWELLEHVGAGTLEDLVRERREAGEPFSEYDVVRILDELAHALRAVHAVGLSHGDIKPANVLVRSRSPLDLVLTDFGTMVRLRASAYFDEGGPRPSAPFAAPERRADVRTPKEDVYAVGRIAELLLRTRLAADAGPDADVLDAVEDRFRWERMLRGTTHRTPAERWSADELLGWVRGGEGRRVSALSGPIVRADPLVVAGVVPADPIDMVRRIAADRTGWSDGIEHLERGRLRTWADVANPDLARALEPDGEIGRIDDPGLRLLEALLWVDPELPPSFAGYSLAPAGVLELLDVRDGAPGWLVARELVDHLAGSSRPIAGRAPRETGVAARAVARLSAGASPARTVLRELLTELQRERRELDAAAAALGLESMRPELRRALLGVVARRVAGVRRRTPGRLALLRYARATRRELARATPPVSEVLVAVLAPRTPLRDAAAAVRRWWRSRVDGARAMVGRRRARRRARSAVAAARVPGTDGLIRVGRIDVPPPRRRLRTVALVLLAVVALSPVLPVVRSEPAGPRPGPAGPPDPIVLARGGATLDGVHGRAALPFGAVPGLRPVAPGEPSLASRWEQGLGPDWSRPVRLDAIGAAAAHGAVVVAGTSTVRVLDASTGREAWSRSVGWPCLGPLRTRATLSSPVVTGDTVFLVNSRCLRLGDQVRALDLATGERRWRLPVPDGGEASMLVPAGEDRLVLVVALPAPRLYSIDARSGEVLWRRDPTVGGGPGRVTPLLAAPVSVGEHVLLLVADTQAGRARLLAVDTTSGLVSATSAPIRSACAFLSRASLAVRSGGSEREIAVATGDGRVHLYRSGSGSAAALQRALEGGPEWTVRESALGLPYPSQGSGTCRPAGVAISDGLVHIAHVVHGTLNTVDAATGELVWSVTELAKDRAAPLDVVPTVTRDAVYIVERQLRGTSRIIEFDRVTGTTTGRSYVLPELLPRLSVWDGSLYGTSATRLFGIG